VSTPELTPDLLRRVAAAWKGGTGSDGYPSYQLREWAERLEREQRPLPALREAAADLVQHLELVVDRWAVMDHDLDARDRELWAPMHRKSKALRAALKADADSRPGGAQ